MFIDMFIVNWSLLKERRIPMKQFLLLLCILTALSFSTTCTTETPETPEPEKQDTGKKIQGVWTLEYMDVGIGQNKRTRDDAQFMMYIMEKHYSAIRDFTPKPAPGEEGSPASPRSFMADAGTYEFDGTDLVVHHMIAAFPVLGSMTFRCSMEGDNTLILEPQYDKMVMPGMENIKPSPDGKMGYGDMAVRYVFKRLE
jgi:hypothetical protein